MTNEERLAQVICRLYGNLNRMKVYESIAVPDMVRMIRQELEDVEMGVALSIEIEGSPILEGANVLFTDEKADHFPFTVSIIEP